MSTRKWDHRFQVTVSIICLTHCLRPTLHDSVVVTWSLVRQFQLLSTANKSHLCTPWLLSVQFQLRPSVVAIHTDLSVSCSTFSQGFAYFPLAHLDSLETVCQPVDLRPDLVLQTCSVSFFLSLRPKPPTPKDFWVPNGNLRRHLHPALTNRMAVVVPLLTLAPSRAACFCFSDDQDRAQKRPGKLPCFTFEQAFVKIWYLDLQAISANILGSWSKLPKERTGPYLSICQSWNMLYEFSVLFLTNHATQERWLAGWLARCFQFVCASVFLSIWMSPTGAWSQLKRQCLSTLLQRKHNKQIVRAVVTASGDKTKKAHPKKSAVFVPPTHSICVSVHTNRRELPFWCQNHHFGARISIFCLRLV